MRVCAIAMVFLACPDPVVRQYVSHPAVSMASLICWLLSW